MPQLCADGRYQCTPAELQALLEETCADLLDDIGFGLSDEELPLIPTLIVRTLQCWHANALHETSTTEEP